jgi:CO/xanthine dehydrogenase Mo-binding subunit
VFDSGQLVNGNLADYMIPSMADTASGRSVTLMEGSYGDGEVHGIGETGLPPVPPAIGNAVANAIGVRITDLPITAEKVLRALDETRPRADSSC